MIHVAHSSIYDVIQASILFKNKTEQFSLTFYCTQNCTRVVDKNSLHVPYGVTEKCNNTVNVLFCNINNYIYNIK